MGVLGMSGVEHPPETQRYKTIHSFERLSLNTELQGIMVLGSPRKVMSGKVHLPKQPKARIMAGAGVGGRL